MVCPQGIKVIEESIEEPNKNIFLIGVTLLSIGIIGFIHSSSK